MVVVVYVASSDTEERELIGVCFLSSLESTLNLRRGIIDSLKEAKDVCTKGVNKRDVHRICGGDGGVVEPK